MIEAKSLVKKFEDYPALNGLTTPIEPGWIYGLVGTNGSGKSTFMRTIAGVYQPDEGSLQIQGADVFENIHVKDKVLFVPDDMFFLPQSTLADMAALYQGIYSGWSQDKYQELVKRFPISDKKKINTFSKGMKRQAAIILAIAAQPDYLLLDEAFDGLDPVIRVAVRKLIADEVASRGMSVLIASHNLRELEDFCDHIGILHQGKLLLERELDDLKGEFCKVQAAFKPMVDIDTLKEKLEILSIEMNGSIVNLIVRGSREEVLEKINHFNPLIADSMPLSLEEVFIYEMEAVGYDYNNIIF